MVFSEPGPTVRLRLIAMAAITASAASKKTLRRGP
jgi:hypothetical protein